MELLKKRREENPELFQKNCLQLGLSFLRTIDDMFVEFLQNREIFEFPDNELEVLKSEDDVDLLYAPVLFKDKFWTIMCVDLKKWTVTMLDFASSKMSQKERERYVYAYSLVIPYILKAVRGEDSNVSPLSILIDKKMPQVVKNEDTGIYMLKVIECHAVNLQDLSRLQISAIPHIRRKLVVDIFAEMVDV